MHLVLHDIFVGPKTEAWLQYKKESYAQIPIGNGGVHLLISARGKRGGMAWSIGSGWGWGSTSSFAGLLIRHFLPFIQIMLIFRGRQEGGRAYRYRLYRGFGFTGDA